jgi:hypothetical protein
MVQPAAENPLLAVRRAAARALTWRAVLLGLLVTVFVNTMSMYSECHGSGNFSWSYLPEGGVVPFLLLVGVNGLLRMVLPRLALSGGELLVVFVMGLVANCSSVFLMFMQLAAIVAPHYFATPANKWEQQLIPYMPPELIVNDRLAAKWMHEGLPPGTPIPWGAWAGPLAWWVPFILVMLLTGYALVALFARQWQDHEKLSYPLMQLPLLLAGEGPRSGRRAFAVQPLFWIGLAIPVFFFTFNSLRALYPSLPKLPMDVNGVIRLATFVGKKSPPMYIWLNWLVLGLGWFVPLELLFSVWFFYLLRWVEVSALNALGLTLGPSGFFMWGQDAISCWQAGGAFFVLALTSVYTGRRYLGERLREALAGARGHPDDLLPGRWVWLLLGGGLAFMIAWLVHFNLPLAPAVVFVFMVMVIYLAISRVLCEAGVFYFTPPLIAQNFTIFALGPTNIGPAGMATLGLSYSWHGDVQTVLPGLSAETFSLRRPMGLRGPQFTGLVWLTVLVGMVTIVWFTLWAGYREGAGTWKTWAFVSWGPETYGQVLSQIQAPFGPSLSHLSVFGIGAVLMLLLTWARLRLNWFPFHPIGFAVNASFTVGYTVWFPFLLAWLVKGFMLRYFGLHAFRMAVPFFLGLGAGAYVGKLIAVVIVTVFGKVLA